MRKLTLCIIIILLAAFAACSGEQGSPHPETQKPIVSASASSQPGSPSETPSNEQAVRNNSYFDGEVYISLSNQDCDFFEDYMYAGPSFLIISKKEIGKANIEIKLPIQTSYSVEVRDDTQRFRTVKYLQERPGAELVQANFEFEHFLMLRNSDWKELARIRNEEVEYMQWFYERYGEIEEKTTLDPEALERWEIIDENEAIMNTYYEAFDEFDGNDIPEYYIYHVSINIPENFSDETADHIDIKLGEKALRLEFGEWRFHSEVPTELKRDNYGIRQEQIALLSIGGSAYDNGYALLPEALSFVVGRDDITVEGVDVFGTDIEVLGAHVRLENADGSAASDYYWDMKMPLDFSAGQKVLIDMIVYSEKLLEYEIFNTMYFTMHYTVNGREHSMITPCYVRRSNDPVKTYLTVFEGIDMHDYHQYYIPAHYGPNLPDFPESWRK